MCDIGQSSCRFCKCLTVILGLIRSTEDIICVKVLEGETTFNVCYREEFLSFLQMPYSYFSFPFKTIESILSLRHEVSPCEIFCKVELSSRGAKSGKCLTSRTGAFLYLCTEMEHLQWVEARAGARWLTFGVGAACSWLPEVNFRCS